MNKVCKTCGHEKPVFEFYRKRNSYESSCKKCKYENAKRHKLNCAVCGSSFFSTKKKQEFCSVECRAESRKNGKNVECSICTTAVWRSFSSLRNVQRVYCSNECRATGVGIHQSGENNPNYKGANTEKDCNGCGKKIRVLNCNLKNPDGSLKEHHYCSIRCKARHQKVFLGGKNNPNFRGGNIEKRCNYCEEIVFVKRHRVTVNTRFYCSQKCKSEHQREINRGEKNPNYKDGLSHDYRARFRIVDGYALWRHLVMEKDQHTCHLCGNADKKKLQAHHLDGYNWAVEKRTDVSNGVALCAECHTDFHRIYGKGNNTRQQFEEYKESRKALL